jgi:transcriptional regulator GlxA family with amidase domain
MDATSLLSLAAMAVALDVGFILLPSFTMTPFAALTDMLRLAADEGDRSRPHCARWRVIGSRASMSSAGTSIAPSEPLGDLARFDHVVVCGGLLPEDGHYDPTLLAALTRARSVIGLCTASFALAEAGLLAGRSACVSWFHHAAFRDAHPDIAVSGTDIFIVDGPVVTCAGGTGAIDIGAWLIERHLGAATARKALDILLAAEGRASDAPQPHRTSRALHDPRLRRVALLVEQRLGSPPGVRQLAATVGMSPRHLARLFVGETGLTPTAFIRDAQLIQSRLLISTTRRPLSHIAIETGFADAAHFSRAFRRRFGVPPSRVDRPLHASRYITRGTDDGSNSAD